jgi:predicted RNA methylase
MTPDMLHSLEARRLQLQAELDAARSKPERNHMGQFATPPALAGAILETAQRLLPDDQPIRFLDPALGTGAFFSALLRVFPPDRRIWVCGYEVDPHYGEPARLLWREHRAEVVIDDFTRAAPPSDEGERFNLIICNPPYVRHHHLTADAKQRLQAAAARTTQAKISGLAGLYVYFMLLAHTWLQQGGTAGWLIPSEFMDVNYGSVLRHYLTSQVTLLRVHRFDPDEAQFGDALVSSAVVWFRKATPRDDGEVRFTFGGSLEKPRCVQDVSFTSLKEEKKWTRFPKQGVRVSNRSAWRLRDVFDIRRGIATGANDFFILTAEQVQQHALPAGLMTPILPSPRCLDSDEIAADANGDPLLKHRLFLLNCDLPEAVVEARYPALWAYLQQGVARDVHMGYLCRHRATWYAQDKRAPAPFLCTYMGRPSKAHAESPFRFILNHSRAVAPNVYLNLYPKAPLADALSQLTDLKRAIWRSLQRISVERLVGEGRVYGGGLYKLEPKELGNLPIEAVFDDVDTTFLMSPRQEALF